MPSSTILHRAGISGLRISRICWRDLADYEGHYIPHGGLCGGDMEPKLAYKELRRFRATLAAQNKPRKGGGKGSKGNQ